jgi:hypothetical protein
MRLVRWVLVVTLGEAVGISVPPAVGVAVTGAVAATCSFTPNCVPHGFLRLLTPALA